jgi:hypothetical protein
MPRAHLAVAMLAGLLANTLLARRLRPSAAKQRHSLSPGERVPSGGLEERLPRE